MKKVVEYLLNYYSGTSENEWNEKLTHLTSIDEDSFIKRLDNLYTQWIPYYFNKDSSKETFQSNSSLAREIQPILLNQLTEVYNLAILAGDINYFRQLTQKELQNIAGKSASFACLLGEEKIARFLFDAIPTINPQSNPSLLNYAVFSPKAAEWIEELIKNYRIDILQLSPEFYNDLFVVSSSLFDKLKQRKRELIATDKSSVFMPNPYPPVYDENDSLPRKIIKLQFAILNLERQIKNTDIDQDKKREQLKNHLSALQSNLKNLKPESPKDKSYSAESTVFRP